jgi:hypothetical protein
MNLRNASRLPDPPGDQLSLFRDPKSLSAAPLDSRRGRALSSSVARVPPKGKPVPQQHPTPAEIVALTDAQTRLVQAQAQRDRAQASRDWAKTLGKWAPFGLLLLIIFGLSRCKGESAKADSNPKASDAADDRAGGTGDGRA